jgi:hypothetical protein
VDALQAQSDCCSACKNYYDNDRLVAMTETEEVQGSDDLLGAEAIDAEQERVAKEELELAQEEEVTENTDPEDDADEEDDEDDVDPPDEQEHDEYDELPPPEEEVI